MNHEPNWNARLEYYKICMFVKSIQSFLAVIFPQSHRKSQNLWLNVILFKCEIISKNNKIITQLFKEKIWNRSSLLFNLLSTSRSAALVGVNFCIMPSKNTRPTVSNLIM